MGLVCSIEVGLDVDVVVLDVNLLQIHTHSSSGILPFTGGRVTGHERGGRGPKRPKKMHLSPLSSEISIIRIKYFNSM